MSAARGVTVVGSLHTDLIASADVLPSLGTSVLGHGFTVSPGGKAANQAAQLARMGIRTWLVSAVGSDALGATITGDLRTAGVDLAHVALVPEVATGASTVITVKGEYASVIVPGASGRLTADILQQAAPVIRQSRFLVTQLELGTEIATAALALARALGAVPVLNASPIEGHDLSTVQGSLEAADVVIVNRYEVGVIDGSPVRSRDAAIGAAKRIQDHYGLVALVITCGRDGAIAFSGDEVFEQAAYPVAVADSVGAGDAFLGGLIAAWCEGLGDVDGLRWGAAAGAICATGHGAFSSLPGRDAVLALADSSRA